MKPIPVKKLTKLINEISETMAEHPEATVTFILRGSYKLDTEGELGVGADVEAPAFGVPGAPAIPVNVGVEWRKQWDHLGKGEFVFRIERGPVG